MILAWVVRNPFTWLHNFVAWMCINDAGITLPSCHPCIFRLRNPGIAPKASHKSSYHRDLGEERGPMCVWYERNAQALPVPI